MSKVKEFLDTKSKARHRVRRQETRSKKLSRIRNHKNNVYHWYKSGYYPTLRDRGIWFCSDEEKMVNGHGYLKRYGCTGILKDCKRTTARTVRRMKVLDEEKYERPIRNAYKRIYDLDNALW